MKRAWVLVIALVGVAVAAPPEAIAQRRGAGPVLHEPIPADPREDVALSVALDGELPAAIQTPRGLVPAPDPAREIGSEKPYSGAPRDNVPDQSFRPDRDTRRPDVLPYDDPFSPSTAPFKRLSAFDTIDANYTLSVRDGHQTPMPSTTTALPDEEQFYGDMVIDLAAGQKVRIPSVGPGAHVLKARAGIGTQDIGFKLYKDGAENWFIESEVTTRARFVMELSAPRAAFGGDFGNPTWAELFPVPPLPPNAARSALEVTNKIGVSRTKSPRDDVAKMVTYFRSFAESEEPPPSNRDIYLDLALSKKGVCRHRAFAFMVTSLSLGIPTRMIVNEAHAWVEVHDGRLWRRIDLGGAGRTLHDPLSQNVPYEPPPDPFSWPHGSTRGEDLASNARKPERAAASAAPSGSAPTTAGSSSSSAFDPNAPGNGNDPNGANGNGSGNGSGFGLSGNGKGTPDDRPPSQVTMALQGQDAHRGAPLKVRGQIVSEGEPCGHVIVEIILRAKGRADTPIGVLATDERGAYDGAIVLPPTVPLGDYDVTARTLGDGRCGRGQMK